MPFILFLGVIMKAKQDGIRIISWTLLIFTISNAQISFHDSGQNLGNLTSTKVALGDIDNDGDLDAIVSNWNHQIRQESKIWFNDGDGIFTEGTQTLPPCQYNVSLGDLDGDDDLDVWMNGWVWINDGSGLFSQSGPIYFGGYSRLGDLDSDSDLDVFAAYGDANMNRVYLNDGTGRFTHSGQTIQQKSGNTVALGDLDGDGDLDAYVVSGANFQNPEGEPDKIWLNDETGTFSDTGQELGQYQAGSVALGDMDGDGDLDALVANWHHMLHTSPQPNELWMNDGNGYFTLSNQNVGESMVSDVALDDLDEDGDLDAFIANGRDTNTGKANEVRVNNGNGQFDDIGLRLGNSPSLGVALGDVDGDGDLDAFIANCGIFDGGHPNKVWLNDLYNMGVEDDMLVPVHVELEQNYPNPFNSSTRIRYSVVVPAWVRLAVFDVTGRKIITLVNTFQESGNYSVRFNALDEYGNSISSGVYIYQISIGEMNIQKRMVLLR